MNRENPKCSNKECTSHSSPYKTYYFVEDIVSGDIKCGWCGSKIELDSPEKYESLLDNCGHDMLAVAAQLLFELNKKVD